MATTLEVLAIEVASTTARFNVLQREFDAMPYDVSETTFDDVSDRWNAAYETMRLAERNLLTYARA